ncbi:hypothetical protein [Citrobacter portucalensis]
MMLPRLLLLKKIEAAYMINCIKYILFTLPFFTVPALAEVDLWVSDAVYKCGDGYVVSFHQSNSTNDVVLLKHDRLISKYSPPNQQTVTTLEGDLVSSTMLTDPSGLDGLTTQQLSEALSNRQNIEFVYERKQHEPWNERAGLIIAYAGKQDIIICRKSN